MGQDRGKARTARALGTLVLLNCLVVVPIWIRFGQIGPHHVALEACIVTATFLLVPRSRWSAIAATGVALVAGFVSLMLLADAAAHRALARPLNLYLDVRLADSVLHLMQGTFGPVRGTLVLAAAGVALLAAIGGVGWLLWGLGVAPEHVRGGALARRDGTRAHLVLPSALLAVGVLAIPLRWVHPAGVSLALPSVQIVREQSAQLSRMLAERTRFEREMREAPARYDGVPGLFAGLEGRDVVLAFIESYGISALDDPRYAPVVRPRLDAMAGAFTDAGLHVVTGQLEAPSQGGMSWLGHGSMLSGLWLDNQLRYDLLLAGDRHTLVDDFEAAGYRTAALMPAIQLAWPEGGRFGYDDIHAFADIDYRGPPLNWVTMPDQFTWSYLQRTVRAGARATGTPLFAELGLISSHAPWTPILEVIEDWDSIRDGEVFARWDGAGERPEELWKDSDRVRESYARSVAYAVDAMAAWAARYVDDDVLLIALGDHQPAPLITGDDAPRSVPVHVIARDPSLLTPFETWGFVRGVIPPATDAAPVRRMSAFRDWFVRAYSDPARTAGR